MRTRLSPILRWVPAMAYVAVNWVLSDLPGDRVGRLPAPDWLLHGLANALFGVALRYALSSRRQGFLLAVALLAAHGALDEWHQSWVPGRTPSLGDWVADVAGGLAGWALSAPGLRSRRFARGAPVHPRRRGREGGPSAVARGR